MLPKKRIRPIAMVPTLFTLGNLWCGFFAMMVTARIPNPAKISDGMSLYDPEQLQNCVIAAVLIFLAMLFDAFDGYFARLSKNATNFGAQLDSLADMVTFGVAPAYLLVKMCPAVMLWNKQAVWIIAATFMSCVALRLARFNSEIHEDDDHSSFKGLPSPAGAAAVASYAFLLSVLREDHQGQWFAERFVHAVEWALPSFALLVAGLMVSRIRYPHLVTHFVHGDRSFQHVVSLVFAGALALIFHKYSLPLICTGFVLYGPARYLWLHYRQREPAQEPMF